MYKKLNFDAWVLEKINKNLKLRALSIPRLKKNQVLVKIKYTGFCSSQYGEIKGIKGRDKYLPHCLGHEAIGAVVDSRSYKNFKIGEKVLLHWMKSKGNDCPQIYYFHKNKKINSGMITTFGEYSVVSENRLTKINCTLKEEKYFVSLGCSISVAFSTIEKILRVKKKNKILILGTGAIGLPMIHFCKFIGAEVDALESKKKAAVKANNFGAIRIFSSFNNRILNEKLRNGYYDFIVDTTGSTDLINKLLSLLSRGTFCSVGVSNFKKKLSFNPIKLNYGLKLLGSYGGSFNPDQDVKRYMLFLRKSKFNFDNYIDKIYNFENLNNIVKDFSKRKIAGKALIKICK